MQRAEERLNAAEGRLNHLGNLVWVAGVVGTIFGIGGAWGVNAILTATKEIQHLQTNVDKVEANVADLSARTQRAQQSIDAHGQQALAQFTEAIEIERERVFSSPAILTVSRLNVVNAEGKPVIELMRNSSGNGVLRVTNQERSSTTTLFAGAARLSSGDTTAQVQAYENGDAGFTISVGEAKVVKLLGGQLGGALEVTSFKDKGEVTIAALQERGGQIVRTDASGQRTYD